MDAGLLGSKSCYFPLAPMGEELCIFTFIPHPMLLPFQKNTPGVTALPPLLHNYKLQLGKSGRELQCKGIRPQPTFSPSTLLLFWIRSFSVVRGCPVPCRILQSIFA